MKKFLAITLTLALTLALFVSPVPANAAVTTQSTTNVLFEDNFDAYVSYGTKNTERKNAMIANGWESQSQNAPFTAASTGSYIGTHNNSRNMMLSFENTKDWAGYSVSGTISFSDVQEERTGDVYGVYVMYANELAAGGYEIGFCLNVDGTKELIMRRRKSTLGGYDTLSCTSRIFDFKTDGTVYNLKAEYNSGVINCYIDGVLELSYDTSNDDVMLTKGSAGIRKINADNAGPDHSIGAAVTFDNFKVERAEKTVWFEENFTYGETDTIDSISGLTDTDIAGIKQNGALPINFSSAHKYLINTKGTAAWNDYSVVSDFTMTRNENSLPTNWFGLSGRMSDESNGYEFTIKVSSDNKIYGRIRKLKSPNGNTPLNESTEYYSFVSGNTYKIKLEFAGNTINGYVNGKLLCTATDDTYSRGTAGINVAAIENCGIDVSVDNYKVSKYIHTTEYFNETFDNSPLSNLDYAQYNTYLTDNDFSNGTLNISNDTGGAYGLYNTVVNSNDYTMEVKATISENITASGAIGVVIGTDTKHKTGFQLYIAAGSNGNISNVKLIHRPEKPSTVTDTSLGFTIGKGNEIKIKFSITPGVNDGGEVTSTATAEISSGDNTKTVTRTVVGEISGCCGIFGNDSGAFVSYDDFKAYPNTVVEYVAPDAIGDMDGDKIVTATDARYIRNNVLGITDTTADLNGDTHTDIRDLVHFKKVAEFYMDNNARDLVMQRYTQDTVWNGNSFKLLAIGNSFSEDSMTYLYNIAKDQGFEDVKIAIVYRGNTTLKNHYDWASANAAEYTYKYYNAEKQGWDETPNYTILEGIKAEKWDMISLQQNSTYAGLPSYFDTVLDYLEEYIHKNKTNPDCKLAYNVTWAYPTNSTHKGFANYNNDQMYMYNRICEAAYQRIYSSFKFDMVFPTGTAIQNARTSLIGDNLNRDEHHLNTLGRYVAACTLFRTISGQPLTELNYVPDTLNIDDTTKAAILEAVNAAAVNPLSVTQSSYTQN